jgi:U3 small nucleolar RNA-associated protein MPP10
MEDALQTFVELVSSEPEEAVASKLLQADSEDALKSTLSATSATLFETIETLAKKFHHFCASKKDSSSTFVLSGLTELLHDNNELDAETIWGQVELQNTALLKMLKKSVKQLERTKIDNIRLLEAMDSSDSDVEEEDADGGDDIDASSDAESGLGNDGVEAASDDENADEEAERMRARMERALEDMEEENDSEQESDGSVDKTSESFNEEELEKDKDAANLHDGFFNLQEMEDFADEEEEYLPDAAFGEEKADDEEKSLDKRSFHQKQRDGDVDNEDSSDLDDNDELLFRSESVRRRKYRKDDEIDALYKLYDNELGGDEDDDDAINMTAEDFFGKPKLKYYERYHNKNRNKEDRDSWDDNDFTKAKTETGWSIEHQDADEASVEEDDESMAMKEQKKSLTIPPTKQAAKTLEQTEQIEKEMLAEKPWQMTGETTSTARPVNSLLEATPEFEAATKLAPVITVEHTENIEEIIKRRILAEDWDDVIPRELPDVAWHKKRGELPEVSQEKSKLSLGELYEREFLKKAVGYDVDAAEKETEEEKAKNEMKTLFANLCSKLDALSNYHFAPRPIADEAEVRPVTQPAIAMEEVMPIHVSDARAVAPEEVYAGKRGREGILRADSEFDQQERKRLRASKKSARRKARRAKLADEKLISRLQPGLGLNNPYEKRKIREELAVARAGGKVTAGKADLNDYSASGTFFNRMQQEAELTIQKQQNNLSDSKPTRTGKSSSALKL